MVLGRGSLWVMGCGLWVMRVVRCGWDLLLRVLSILLVDGNGRYGLLAALESLFCPYQSLSGQACWHSWMWLWRLPITDARPLP